MFLDYFALGVLIFVFLVIFYGIIILHDIPYLIAKKRNHPHADAIHVAGWVSLFTLHVIWPFLWIWATLYRPERGWGTVKASAAADVLDNSNGWVGELSVFHKMQIGRLSLTPALGVLYYDENFSDYYYGISESESRRSGLASYSAQDAWVPYVSLTAKYPIGEHVVLMASAGYSELPEEITDSPMIDRNESFTFVTGVSWRF